MPRSSLLLPCVLALAGCATTGRAPVAPVPIGAIQGTGATSPLVGQVAAIDAVVTQRLDGAAGGVFVQDAGDGDPRTSDGLLLTGPATRALVPGQQVVASGRVVEMDTGRGAALTTLEVSSLHARAGAGMPPALALPPAQLGEAQEGMRVAFDTLVLAGHADFDDDGTLLAAVGTRPWTPTERARPGSAQARAIADANAATRVHLDDGVLEAAPAADGPWPDSLATARTGSTLHGVDGVLDHRDGGWRVQLRGIERVQPAPRPEPPRVPGDVRVAALNLENLFNGDGAGGGFPTPRGARTRGEFEVQLARHVATLRALDADVVALMEVENDGHGPRSAEGELVAALGAQWRAVEAPGRLGTDAIRVGLAYRADRVRPVGRVATLDGGPFADRSRVPLAGAFVALDARGRPRDAPFAVVANHFKSKGCGGAQGADADQRDGQSCYNATRVESARRLHAWLAGDPTGASHGRTLILGDLNAHTQEDPLAWLAAAGWRDAFALAGIDDSYSYVFQGQVGRLDHALASPALAPHVAGAAKWHTNADEPVQLGYRAAPQATGPWRSSDHDPLVVGLRVERAR